MLTTPRSAAHRYAPFALIAAATLVLGGCATATTPTTTAATPDVEAAQEAPRGVSGEIAAISDGVLQVQDTDSQTAVSWTADTVVSVETTGALADVGVGSCVVAIGDAETVSSLTVTAAVDGECATPGGFPGGTGGPGGDGTEGAPTGMPTDGEAPEGMPSGMPTDGATGGFGGSFSSGIVTAVDGTTITIETADGETATVEAGTDTTITTTIAGDSSAFAVGLCASADGESDSSGGFAATSITVSQPGDEGCSAFPAGGMPGGAPRNGEDSE